MNKKTVLSLMLTSLCISLFSMSVQAQFIQIQAIGPVDVCYPACVNMEVVSPQAGYTYNWFVGVYDCNSVGNSTPISAGSTYCAMATGQFYCMGLPPAGPPEISNPIDVRNLPGSLGSIYLPAPIPSGSSTCVPSVSLCIPYGFYQGYPNTVIKWYKNNSLISGASGGSYTATASGYYKYTITSCVMAPSDSILVTLQPDATITLGGPSTVCSGQNVGLSVPVVAGNSYQWKLAGSVLSGATNPTYAATAAGSYTVTVTNNGCSKTSTTAINVIINPLPNASITPSGPTAFCTGSNVTLNASTGAGYTWQWLLNGNVIIGATSSGYLATSSGNYAVKTTSNGCSQTSASVTVTSNSLPGAAINAGGNTIFCQGGSITLSAPVGAGYSYIWKKSGTTVNGATSQTYNAASSGNYKVVVTNPAGCTKQTTNPTVVTVNPLPAATITPLGPTTFCAGGNVVLQGNTGAGLSFKWKRNGTVISGATNSNYTALLAGTYKIQVTSSLGCSKVSAGTVITVPCKNENDQKNLSGFDAEVYPNPSNGNFNFNLVLDGNDQSGSHASAIRIFDITGKTIHFESNLKNSFSVPGDKLAPGIYTAILTNTNHLVYKKIIKIK